MVGWNWGSETQTIPYLRSYLFLYHFTVCFTRYNIITLHSIDNSCIAFILLILLSLQKYFVTDYESVKVYIQIPEANINYLIDDVTMNLIEKNDAIERGSTHQN